MTDLARLLPPSIADDPIMAAAGQAAGTQEEIVRGLIDNAYIWSRLDELPEDLFDHLAWSLHIDGYEYADSLEKKRWLVVNFHDLHRFKGTVYGHRLYWRVLLDRELLSATPPHKFYWGASPTQAEREAWEAPHPEIRVYPFRKRTTDYCWCWGAAYFGADHLVRTDAINRVGSQMELHDPKTGVATTLNQMLFETGQVEKIADDVVDVRLPAKHKAGVQWGAMFFGDGFWVDQKASERLYTLRLKRPYQDEEERRHALSVKPSLEPMTTYYREVREKAPHRAGVFWANRYPDRFEDVGGACFWGMNSFFVDQDSGDRIHKRLKLFDPARAHHAERDTNLFWGAFRFGGMPAHTAEVAVDMIGPAATLGLYWGSMHWGGHHLFTSEADAAISQACHVGRLAKRRSDKIDLSITNRRAVTANTGVIAGKVTAGDYQMEVY